MAGGGNVYNKTANALTAAGQATGKALGYQPQQVGYTPASAGMAGYQNPFNQQVLGAHTDALNRGREMALNTNGAAATAAGAFGGSRHGLVEAETNRGFADALGNTSAQLGMQGWNSSLGAAQTDAAQNLGAQQFNVNSGLQGQQQQLGAAAQLGNLSNLGFGMGQQIGQQQMQQGTMQQGLIQQIINGARGQFGGFTGNPGQSLGYPLAAIGASPAPTTTTQSRTPGLFDYLSLGLGTAASWGK